MPVKIQNSFSPTSEVGAALNNAITTYANSIPTYGEVQEGRVNANKADAPALMADKIRALYGSSGGEGQPLTPMMVQDQIAGLAEASAMGGDVGKLGDLLRVVVANAANPESVQMIDRAQQGAGQAYNTTETGFNIDQRNDLEKVAMQQAGADRRASTMAAARPGTPGGPAKPLPVGALKMQEEALDALSIAGNITADMGAIKQQIVDGKLQLGPATNIGSNLQNFMGMSSENSRNYDSFKKTLEQQRNASLRLNKGVQTEGDSKRAWNELLTNLNDPELVVERLDEIMAYNERAAELQKMKISSVRNNYGLGPLDLSKYSLQPAIGASGTGNADPAAAGASAEGIGAAPIAEPIRKTINGVSYVNYSGDPDDWEEE